MSLFGTYTRIRARSGQRDTLVDLLCEAATAPREVPDCALYIVNTAPADPDEVWVTEVWRDSTAHQAYLATDAFKAALGRGRALIERMEEQIEVVPVRGKGLQP